MEVLEAERVLEADLLGQLVVLGQRGLGQRELRAVVLDLLRSWSRWDLAWKVSENQPAMLRTGFSALLAPS